MKRGHSLPPQGSRYAWLAMSRYLSFLTFFFLTALTCLPDDAQCCIRGGLNHSSPEAGPEDKKKSQGAQGRSTILRVNSPNFHTHTPPGAMAEPFWFLLGHVPFHHSLVSSLFFLTIRDDGSLLLDD